MDILWLLIIGLLSATWVSAQEAPFTLKVDVALVSLDVGVDDSAGRPVMNLGREDFLVFEDGRLQEIRNFSPVDTPYNILFLFDCSESTQEEWLLMSQAMIRFTDQLRLQDRVSVAVFGGKIRVLLEWGARRGQRLDLYKRPELCIGTDFYGALNWAAKNVDSLSGRKGVIIFGDGAHNDMPRREVTVDGMELRRIVDPADDKDFLNVLRTVRASGAAFYFVAVHTDFNPKPRTPLSTLPDLRQIRARMELVADASGGRIVFPQKPEDVVPMYEEIGRELGTAYSLGYFPPNLEKDGKRHKIEVRVRDPNLRVRQSRLEYDAK